MDTIDTIRQIQQNFGEGRPPFDDIEFPEERLLDELPHNSKEERARIVTMFATFDYNRDANQLVDNLVELHERDANLFDPWYVTDQSDEETFLKEHFEHIGFRYPNRDARGWYKNCEILRNKYNGRVTELILDTGCDAPTLVEQLRDDGLLYLKGKKIAPMYARILSDEVAELDNLWELDIPTDTHIVTLTEKLSGTEMDADNVREWWQVIGGQYNISRHVVDAALWQIGNNWEQWGETYWHEVTEE